MTSPLDAAHSLPAEVVTPAAVELDSGAQGVLLALRTETGTIVYAELLPAEADVLSDRLGRLAYDAKQVNEQRRGGGLSGR